VKLTIDGKPVTAREGETVLDCALRHDISIPHLCTHPDLPAFGACRLCVVEIDGLKGLPSSCTTPAAEGMVVRTDTPELNDLRRGTLELIMLEHPSACLVCDKRELCEKYRPAADKAGCTTGCHTCNNKAVCEVRQLSESLGLSELPVAPFYRAMPVETSDPFIDRDLNLCILCGRCVRICKAQHGSATIDFIARGGETRIGPAFGRSLVEAGCRFCGSCVDVCPTGCLADRFSKWYGAADSAVETTCTLCDAACAIRVHSAGGRCVRVRPVDTAVPICVLGRFATVPLLRAAGRLRAPRVRHGDALREVGWDAALAAAAEKLSAHTGERFAIVCDGSATLEDRHVFRAFAEDVMKSGHFIVAEPDARGVATVDLPAGVTAAVVTGDFFDPAQLDALEALIVLDCLGSDASERADVVFPAAVLSEIDGTCVDCGGTPRPLHKACEPPGEARPDWRTVAALARAMGAEGFDFESAEAVARAAGVGPAALWVERDEAPPAALDPRKRRTHFRGHRLAETVPALEHLPVGDEGLES